MAQERRRCRCRGTRVGRPPARTSTRQKVIDLLRAHGPMTVPQMGRAQALSRQFVQRMVNDAAAQQLVEGIPNPAHQRSSLIRRTEEGSAAITGAVSRERAVLRQVGGDLTDADVEACVRVLTEMLRLFDNVDVN
ncbi:MarR family winged helix-turn-helix transcriptional regulator [Streptomyces sp. BP-8]|uniref:MarR family winged helix-turn-helix transcriptional regulator n=1 Tax=Streptomyces sirii TaxID=3127701 RepID=UPI00388D4606